MKTAAALFALTAIVAGVSLSAQTPSPPSSIKIDLASARAVLTAVTNPQLTHEDALHIAELAGNQGLIRKENSYGRAAKTADLADALFAVAHGQPASEVFAFHFESVKKKAPMLIALIDSIDARPAAFRGWVIQRVAAFSPPNGHTAITGYLVAGGGSGGFSFSEPGFYLNLNYFSDFDTARVVMAHELYHAVQNIYVVTYSDTTKPWFSKDDAGKNPNAALAQQCSTTADLFEALYQEGSASYVGDIQLLDGIDTPDAKKNFDEFKDGLSHIGHDTTLLELSITGLEAPHPVPFEDVYSLGFYVPAPLYNLGYVMAKAIDKDSGRAAFIASLSQPAWRFADAYLQLPLYSKDHDHPKLGANTVDAVHRLATGCPRL